MGETRAEFAESTVQSLKKIIYRYMEEDGYRYTHILPHFITTRRSRKNCSVDLIAKSKDFRFLSPFCTASLDENVKNQSLKLDRVHISKYDPP